MDPPWYAYSFTNSNNNCNNERFFFYYNHNVRNKEVGKVGRKIRNLLTSENARITFVLFVAFFGAVADRTHVHEIGIIIRPPPMTIGEISSRLAHARNKRARRHKIVYVQLPTAAAAVQCARPIRIARS